MVRYIDRNGNEIDDNGWKDPMKIFTPYSSYNVYGVDDVIDIMLLGYTGTFYSVNPYIFRNIMGSNIGASSPADYSPKCHDGDSGSDTTPIYTLKQISENDINRLCKKANDDKAGGWQNDGNEEREMNSGKDGDGKVPVNWSSLNGSNDRCTEFGILFNRINEMSHAVAFHGYQFFNPENLAHRRNWIRYDQTGNTYDRYMIVMYLTTPKLLLEKKFLRSDDLDSPIREMIKSYTSGSAIVSLVNDRCIKQYPDGGERGYSRLSSNTRYYMGTTIYSKDSRYKLVFQPDGNLVVYKYDNTSPWSSGTYGSPKSTLYMQPDGNVVIYNSSSTPKWNTNTFVKSVYLSVDSNEGVVVLRESETDNVVWSSIGPQDTYNNNYKDYNTFKYQTDYKASDKKSIFSPNMKYKLRFQSDANLILTEIKTDKVLWGTGVYGYPDAVLSVQKDGNVVIYETSAKSKVLWSIGVWGTEKNTFMAVDNNGHVVVYRDDNGLKLVWSSVANSQYYTLYNGLQGSKLWNDPMAFTRGCTTANYGDSKIDKRLILDQQAAWCATNLNIMDSRCSKFLTGSKLADDDNDQTIKAKVDDYVKNTICSDGYNTRYTDDPALQTKINDLCSCVSPIGDALKLLSGGVNPICYSNNCINGGYKSINTEKSRTECPSCLCIQSMDLKNLQLAENIKQECSANCQNLNGGSTTTTPQAPPAIPPSTAPPGAPTGPPTGSTTATETTTKDSSSTTVDNSSLMYIQINHTFDDSKDWINAGSRPAPHGKYSLKFTTDGNLLLVGSDAKTIWQSNTAGNSGAVLSVSPNGVATIYKDTTKSQILWKSTNVPGTYSKVFLAADNNGCVVLYGWSDAKWKMLWVNDTTKYVSISSIELNTPTGVYGSATYTDPNGITTTSTEVSKKVIVNSGPSFSVIAGITLMAIVFILFILGLVFRSKNKPQPTQSYQSSPFQNQGYRPPAPQYSAPAPYPAPAPQYSAPAPQYSAPAPQYSAPAPQYSAPAPAPYSAPMQFAPVQPMNLSIGRS